MIHVETTRTCTGCGTSGYNKKSFEVLDDDTFSVSFDIEPCTGCIAKIVALNIEMLKALKIAAEELEDTFPFVCLPHIQKAIAKAEGKS